MIAKTVKTMVAVQGNRDDFDKRNNDNNGAGDVGDADAVALFA